MEISITVLTILLFGSLIGALALGIPLAFSLGGIAIIFSFFVWGPHSLYAFANLAKGTMHSILLIAIPLFIFMANILERSGIGDDLYELMYNLLSFLKGGLAAGTVVISTIFAAMSGVSGAATVTMGVIALPSMLKRGYDREIALGSISAGGALGILIPPSITMIVYALMSGESVGKLFMGGVFPGLLLSTMFIVYILVRSQIQPYLGPAVPKGERLPFRKTLSLSKGLVLPVFIITGVLGSIFTGIATPTEAAAVGAFLTVIASLMKRTLTWGILRGSLNRTLQLSVMCLWIVLGATWFSSVYHAIGAPDLIREIINSLGVNRWLILVGIQFTFFILGMLMDPIGIIMITTPVFIPVITQLGFDTLWFGVVFVVNMEMALMTPPFGANLFYLKGVVPPEISMGDIYRSIVPFVGLQMIGLVIVIIFPQIITFLPSLMWR